MNTPPQRDLTHDEVLDLSFTMTDRGGRFAKTMGAALLCADSSNQRKLLDAFWSLYAAHLPVRETT